MRSRSEFVVTPGRKTNQNAGIQNQIERNLAIVRLCHVQGDAALIAVDRREIDTGYLVVRRIESPIVADVRLLDLNDIGTEVAQNLGTPGPWQKTVKSMTRTPCKGRGIRTMAGLASVKCPDKRYTKKTLHKAQKILSAQERGEFRNVARPVQ